MNYETEAEINRAIRTLEEIIASEQNEMLEEITALPRWSEGLESTEKNRIEVSSLSDFENQPLLNQQTGKEIRTVKEAKRYFEQLGYEVENSTYMMCREIEKTKKKNKNVSTVELVEDINSILTKKSVSSTNIISFGIVAQASEKYQVAYAEWSALTTEEKVLIVTDPKKAVGTKAVTEKAYSMTKKKFGYNGLGDKSDGFRHAVWNALMARDIGKSWAKSYATAHESGKTKAELNKKARDGYKEKEHRKMDLHNNKIGRSVIKWYDTGLNVSDKELQKRVSKKLTNNKKTGIYWLHK